MSNITPLRSPQEPRDAVASGLAGGAGPQSGRPQTKPPFLADLLIDTSPERMAKHLASFRASVHDSLFVSSKAYRLLSELEKADLADCVPCTAGLRETLANNPHFVVLKTLEEAERKLADLDRRAS